MIRIITVWMFCLCLLISNNALSQEQEKQGAILERLKILENNVISLKHENQLLKELIEKVDHIKKEIDTGNPWVPFTKDLRKVVDADLSIAAHKNPESPKTPQYEYAIFRNGGFRKLTWSTWGGGYRVMTEPYMTGNFPWERAGGPLTELKYRIGGSLWVWDNPKDTNTKNGVYHYYYLSSSDGFIANYGNGLITQDTEGWIYRRKMK
ncbi:MAG: hypothetical protein HQK65_14520 [Desulfamplus sp.]|nr:hypothetical protein [Desulfamplus sp.]